MKSVTLKKGRYSLSRKRDGRGDSGLMLQSLKFPEPEEGKDKIFLEDLKEVGENGEIHVGCAIQCGGIFARSYSAQDWWLTTPVSEIIETKTDDNGEVVEVEFKTGNSYYIAKSF